MYDYLRGKLTRKNPLSITIDCGGVGYLIKVPLTTFEKLPALEEEVEILIHFSANENEIRLFGFLKEIDRQLFQLLTSISRIGPKIGISILSGIATTDLVDAIKTENVKLLSSVPGLGKKSAQRIIIELKDKITKISPSFSQSNETIVPNSKIADAESALLILGYKTSEVSKILIELTKKSDFNSSEALIKSAIKELYKKR